MSRDDIIRMAREAGLSVAIPAMDGLPEVWNVTSTPELERLVNAAYAAGAAAEREAFMPVLAAAKQVLDWTEIAHRPPMRDQLEIGRMVHVRLHALADLHDAVQKMKATVASH